MLFLASDASSSNTQSRLRAAWPPLKVPMLDVAPSRDVVANASCAANNALLASTRKHRTFIRVLARSIVRELWVQPPQWEEAP
jgi:hypothetical protein